MFPFDGAPGGVVPVLGWAVWPRGCGCITFSLLCLNPRPAGVRPGSQATDVGLSAGGVTAPGGAGSSVLLGRNAGKQRPFQHHLGRQQVPGTSTGILQGNRETVQRMCRVQVFPCPHSSPCCMRDAALSTCDGWEALRCGAVRMFSAECSCVLRAAEGQSSAVSPRAQPLTLPQRSCMLLCGFLCSLFPFLWASSSGCVVTSANY